MIAPFFNVIMGPVWLATLHSAELTLLLVTNYYALRRMFPKQASIMAKKSIQWNPVLGPFMNLSGTVFIDRGNSAQAHRSLEAAGEGMKARKTSLFIFAEGTRHSEEKPNLLPFKKGAFHLAVKGGIPIVPVVCENYWRLYHNGVFGTGTIKIRGTRL